MHLFQRSRSFWMRSEKNVLGWAASHSCTASFTSSPEVNRRPLKASFSGPKNGSPRGRDRDCMQDVPTPWNPVSQEFEECGWQYVGARCHATTEHLTTIGLGVWFELQVSVRYSASHYTLHCLLLCPFPDHVPVTAQDVDCRVCDFLKEKNVYQLSSEEVL